MSRIVITGATGFIGRHLVAKFIKEQYEVVIIARPSSVIPAHWKQKYNIYVLYLDLNNVEEITNSIKSADYFIHLAWEGSSGENRNNLELQISNIVMSLQCFKAAVALKCKKVIFAGTISEYLVCTGHRGVITYYSVAKFLLHKFLDVIGNMLNIPIIWARFSNVYGLGNDTGNLLCYIFNEYKANRCPTFSNGEQILDFICVEDVVEIINLILKKNCSLNELNVVSGEPKTIEEYIGILDELYKTDFKCGLGARQGTSLINKREWFIEPQIKDVLDFEFKKTFCDWMKEYKGLL